MNRGWFNPNCAEMGDFLTLRFGHDDYDFLNDACKKYRQYLESNNKIIELIGCQVYGYKLAPLNENNVRKGYDEMYL